MPCNIVAIADIHAAEEDPVDCPTRRGAMAEILLFGAVRRINCCLKPDVTVLLGDLLDHGEEAGAPAMRQRLRAMLDLLDSPVIVIPGNHDGNVEAFYREMPRPAESIEAGGARFLAFLDPEEPNYQARRTTVDLRRMKQANTGFNGPIVTLQHVPLLPLGQGSSPYRFTNDKAILRAMRAGGITLAISGHYHYGEPLIRQGTEAFIVTPAFCEEPFVFLQIILDGEAITVNRHELRLPMEFGKSEDS